jgi:hypothetical protein
MNYNFIYDDMLMVLQYNILNIFHLYIMMTQMLDDAKMWWNRIKILLFLNLNLKFEIIQFSIDS